MSDPLVTVVIPSYNYGHFVTQAVDSALAQTYPRREIVVVDDGSTDDTAQRLSAYGERIRYIRQANQGLHAARNTGIAAARGELIAFLDSDDLWHPRKLELQVRCFREHPQAGLVAAETAATLAGGWAALPEPMNLVAEQVTLAQLLVCSRFGASSVVVRRECLTRLGTFEDGYRGVEDRDLWIRIAAHYPVYHLKWPLWWYREHGTSMSFGVARMEEHEIRVLRRALATLPALRGRWLLRRKALARTAVAAAHMYDVTGRRGKALARLFRSFLLWPWPFRRSEVKSALLRPKMILLIFWSLFRGNSPPDPTRMDSKLVDAGRLGTGSPKDVDPGQRPVFP